MKRDHPDVIEWPGSAPLPASAERVVSALGPVVTEARLARMRGVLERRTSTLIPVLEDLADPHNGAAVLRSADAFGCHEVHVVEDRHAFAISHRVSRGTERWLEVVRHGGIEGCLEALAERGFKVFIAAMDGETRPEALAEIDRAAIVFGNEHRGVSDAVRAAASGTYAIPMVGFVESLNVSVASAITLYVASRGRHGDLSPEARERALARYLLGSVRDAERIVEEHEAARKS